MHTDISYYNRRPSAVQEPYKNETRRRSLKIVDDRQTKEDAYSSLCFGNHHENVTKTTAKTESANLQTTRTIFWSLVSIVSQESHFRDDIVVRHIVVGVVHHVTTSPPHHLTETCFGEETNLGKEIDPPCHPWVSPVSPAGPPGHTWVIHSTQTQPRCVEVGN